MIIGVWFMSYFIFVRPMKKLCQSSTNVATASSVSD